MRTKIIQTLAFVSVLLFIIGLITDNLILRIITKPLPVLSWSLLIIPLKNKYRKWIFLGFLFSIAGDILLELPYDFFMYGLIAFMLAHLNYIVAFIGRDKSLKIIALAVLIIFAIIISYFILPGTGEMKIPVLIYLSVILLMVWRAYSQRKHDKYAVFAFWGAVFFLISDTIIALNKFCCSFNFSQYIIILMYWIGQYGIFISAYHIVKAD